jgi:drug/metabolite transporter (DMT)-like permease
VTDSATSNNPSSTVTRATLLIVFSACCFGSIPILATLATRSGISLSETLFWRYAIAAVMFVMLSGGLRAVKLPTSRASAMLVLLGGGQAAVAFLSLSALKFIPAASVTFLFYTYPAWVAIMSAIRGIERLTPLRAAALLCSLGGLAIMIGTPGAGGLNIIGATLALASALLYACYIPLINHLGSGINPSVTSTYATVGAGAIFLGASLSSGVMTLHFTPTAAMSILLLAVVCTVLAFLAFLRGLSELGPVRTAIVSTVEPFWAALLASIVLGQVPGVRTFIGGALIAVAVVALQISHRPATT